jgi:ADP-heptose:LPS heptosyltransferase
MKNLYDYFLHRSFSTKGLDILFRAGLVGRKWYFAARSRIGSMLYHPRNKNAVIDPQTIRKILVIRTDRIGDIILSTPALRMLRYAFPQATIAYVVQKKYAPLLRCYSGWDKLYEVESVFDKNEIGTLGRQLRDEHFSAAIVGHPSSYGYRLAALAKAGYTIGWEAKGYGYLCTHSLPDDRAVALRHQVENNIRLLEPLGIHAPSAPVPFPVQETASGQKQIVEFCEKEGIAENERFIVMHPGSYSPRVRWMPERFGELINRAAGAGIRTVLLGSGASDREAVEAVLQSTTTPPTMAVDRFDLEGLVSLMKRATIFVGNSTGPMHIAASTGIWTIAIFGNRYPLDHYKLWRPYSDKGIVVTSEGCRVENCIPWTCPEPKCMLDITVEMVWSRIEQILEERRDESRL